MGVLKAARAKSGADMGDLSGHFHGSPIFLLHFCVSLDTVTSTPVGAPSTRAGFATPMPRAAGRVTCHVGSEHIVDPSRSGITLKFLRSQVF
jgi:hypothetical protein